MIKADGAFRDGSVIPRPLAAGLFIKSLPTESTLDNIELSLAGLDVSKDVKIVDYWFYVEHNGILKNISLSTTNWEKISNIDIQKNHPQWVMKVILTDKSKFF